MNSFCSLFWTHLCIRHNSSVQPCCQYSDNLGLTFDGNLSKSLNHQAFKELRRKAAGQEHIPGCKVCYDQEAAGYRSLRINANIKFPNIGDSLEVSPTDVKTAELFIGDICNLKCVMCGPDLSTSWREDYEKLGWVLPPRTRNNAKLDSLIAQLPSIETIKFVGGEPLLSKTHEALICSVEDEMAKKITLDYNTNATVIPHAKILKSWEKFRKINLWLSIDGFEKVNDFIRFPSQWSQVQKAVRSFIELQQRMPNLNLKIICTVSAYNISSIDSLIGWLRSEGLPKFVFNPVISPSFMRPSNLPEPFFSATVERLLEGDETSQIIGRYLTLTKEVFNPELVTFTQQLAFIRNITIRDYLPDLYFLWTGAKL
jgi:sulfatase maturation enzyme AslB (radical SAM superfamily)